ncbi:MAG: SusC/RagA family TonB-linked outer membrane protein [Mariniphaga sp.]|nr:SusC/RagA family TonB-linked outer membrane protein [Mariniphaga sp.]
MEKNDPKQRHRRCFVLKKMLNVMKLTTLLLFIPFFQVAAHSYAQETRLNLKFEKETLENVFSKIEQSSDFSIFYKNELIKNSKEVSGDFKNVLIFEVLDQILKTENLTYSVKDKLIMIVAKESETNATTSQQQGKKVTGKVTDSTGGSLPGVSVVVKGTTTGVVTDNNGTFSLANVPENATLQFSFVGMKTLEIAIGTKKAINVKLVEDAIGLEEVVAVGYGTQKKTDLTGSVASVSAANLKERAATNFGEAMIGQIAGVQIQQINGAPGGEGLSVRIRGTGSITQSSEPLYVVDGYPMEGGAFRLLNPSDIESMQVLKDASSTAIYGSRGANGVVIINTKKGKAGAPVVNFNMYTGIQQREKTIDMMNRDQYVSWFTDGRNQAWLDASIISADPNKLPHATNDPNSRRKLYPSANTTYMIPDGTGGALYNFLDPASVAQMPDNNWQNLLFRNAKMEQYELSLSGGTEKTQYAFSASYMKQEGISINTDYSRFNFKTNIETKITDRLKVGINMNAYYSTANEQASGKDSPIMYALNLPPIYPLNNPDGTYGSMVRNPEVLAGDVANPIGIAEQIYNKRLQNGWMGILFAEWEIMKDLKYKMSVNGGVQQNNQKRYQPSFVDLDGSKAPRPAQGINEAFTDVDWVVEQTLTYQKTFAKLHNLTVLAGYTNQKHSYDHTFGEARGFPNDNIYTLNAGTMYQLSTDESNYSMISYLARVNYAYNNRYMLTATVRSDGSSRFGKNNKWGSFPSLSVGWRVDQENFMQNIEVVNDLKIRASYGIAGNNRIGNYSSIGLLNIGFYPTGDALQNSVNPSTMSNSNLGWEKTRQMNAGFDLGLFKNRISLAADFYDSQSIELLLNVPVPSITGYATQMQNVGKVQNRGMEFQLSTKNIVSNKFKWSSDFNISFNKNKVLEVGPDGRPIYGSAPNANNAFITKPGFPIASFYGYVFQGVFMNQAELDKYPHLAADKVGDGRYLDVNKDGKMDQNDKDILGSNNPKFTAGLNNNFSYKNFTLGVQLTGVYGSQLFSFFKRMVGVYHGDRNGLIEQVDRWRSIDSPGDGIHFRPTRNPTGWQRDPSSAWVTNASYIRLRNVSLAYDFNISKIKQLKLSGLRFYITGQNLFTFTKYPGYDPDTSSQGDGLAKGGDYLGYPAARSVILGVNVTF